MTDRELQLILSLFEYVDTRQIAEMYRAVFRPNFSFRSAVADVSSKVSSYQKYDLVKKIHRGDHFCHSPVWEVTE